MFTECSHSVKSSQILPSGDAALGKNGTLGKMHRIRTNLVLFSVLPSATLGKTDRISVLPSATLGKICPHNFFLFVSVHIQSQ